MVPAPARPLPRGFDGPIHIGHEQTCSQPSTVRDMLTLLDVRTGQHVLDIGSGSGWTTALLAALVGPTGRLVATNPDRYCPYPGGRGEPDCAAVVAAIEASTGVRCSQVIGKPDPAIAALALDGLDVDPARCAMVGDRLATDVALGRRAGMVSVLVLTGDSDADDVRAAAPEQRPTHVVDGLGQLIPSGVGHDRIGAL